METVTLWVGIVGPVAGLVGAWLVHLAARRDSRRTGETDFRDDLMETIDKRDTRILELEKQIAERDRRIEEKDGRIQDLRDRNVELAADNAALRGRNAQ